MHRIIITGGSGFIGRHLAKRLLSDKGNAIVLLSNTPNLQEKFLAQRRLLQDMPITFHTADIRDRESMLDLFQNERPDICIHLAAKTGIAHPIVRTEETMDINVKGTLNTLEACHRSKVNNFVFASSAAVYGDIRELPIKEDYATKPVSTYGTSKMLAEQHVASFQRSKKIPNTVSLRVFSVYGSGQSSAVDVITRFAARLSRGLPPVIYGDGLHTRDFISVDDVVEGILLSLRAMDGIENGSYGLPLVFNIGTGTPTSIKQLAHKMIGLFGLELEPIYEQELENFGVIEHSYADTTRAKELLCFVAKKGLDTGLSELVSTMNHNVPKN